MGSVADERARQIRYLLSGAHLPADGRRSSPKRVRVDLCEGLRAIWYTGKAAAEIGQRVELSQHDIFVQESVTFGI